jgi:hypothetical protein
VPFACQHGPELSDIWSVTSGRLPTAITLSREGVLHGEPWAAGTYAFTVRATDSQWPAKSMTQQLSITVAGEMSVKQPVSQAEDELLPQVKDLAVTWRTAGLIIYGSGACEKRRNG